MKNKNKYKNKKLLLIPIINKQDIIKAKKIYKSFNFSLKTIIFQDLEKNKKFSMFLKK